MIVEATKDGRPCIGDSVICDEDGHHPTADWVKDTTTCGGHNAHLCEAEEASHEYFVAVEVVAAGAFDVISGEEAGVVTMSKLGVMVIFDETGEPACDWTVVHKHLWTARPTEEGSLKGLIGKTSKWETMLLVQATRRPRLIGRPLGALV